jgi:hypothetical protein
MVKKNDDKEYVEVEGIKCEVKDSKKKAIVEYYQNNLDEQISDYVAKNRMVDSKKAYADALRINVKIAPFVLGWLKRPEDEDEYRVITGRMTIEELNKKKGATKSSQKSRKTTTKPVEPKKPIKSKGATKEPETTQKTPENKKSVSKKPAETKKSIPKTAPKNPPKK